MNLVARPRFVCLIPGCGGVLPDGSNLWQHAEWHNTQQTEQARHDMERWAEGLGFKHKPRRKRWVESL